MNGLDCDNTASNYITIKEKKGWIERWFDPLFCGFVVAFLCTLMRIGNPIHWPVYLIYIIGVVGFQFYRFGIRKGDIPVWISISVSCIGILAGISTYAGLWWKIPYWDAFIHVLIHLLIGVMAYRLWSRYIEDEMYKVSASLSTVIMFGLLIELAEWLLWILFGISMAPAVELFYMDTMEDFLWDILGGGLGILVVWAVGYREPTLLDTKEKEANIVCDICGWSGKSDESLEKHIVRHSHNTTYEDGGYTVTPRVEDDPHLIVDILNNQHTCGQCNGPNVQAMKKGDYYEYICKACDRLLSEERWSNGSRPVYLSTAFVKMPMIESCPGCERPVWHGYVLTRDEFPMPRTIMSVEFGWGFQVHCECGQVLGEFDFQRKIGD